MILCHAGSLVEELALAIQQLTSSLQLLDDDLGCADLPWLAQMVLEEHDCFALLLQQLLNRSMREILPESKLYFEVGLPGAFLAWVVGTCMMLSW
jgi:hypothetical protein